MVTRKKGAPNGQQLALTYRALPLARQLHPSNGRTAGSEFAANAIKNICSFTNSLHSAPRFPTSAHAKPYSCLSVFASLCLSLYEHRRVCLPTTISPTPIRLFAEFMESIQDI